MSYYTKPSIQEEEEKQLTYPYFLSTIGSHIDY